jgi:cation diffusion facilitator CzcD-associated flavoprotein CzcO
MSPPLPSVCMIGAGSSGIAAAKERAGETVAA